VEGGEEGGWPAAITPIEEPAHSFTPEQKEDILLDAPEL
jgi:hypothetical protein